MKNLEKIDAYIDGQRVGTLAMMPDGRAAFQYDAKWQKEGFAISPFDLPLTNEVFIPKNRECHGLFGIFEDSLPDAWGTLLMNRKMNEMGINPGRVNVLDRLSLIGDTGSGDIEYKPAAEGSGRTLSNRSLDELQESCIDLLKYGNTSNLDELFLRGGSSGGTRPKIYTEFNDSEWIIKFPTSADGMNSGKLEYEYSVAARECGIEMSDTRLFESQKFPGYFGTKRFDRTGNGGKIHMATVKALLNLPFDTPNLDYLSLMQLTDVLTGHDRNAVIQMFTRACFNVFAHNQDDHSKNFAFLYDKELNRWYLSPAYDLTYSTTAYNQHTTSVNWNGINPGREDLLAITKDFDISGTEAETIVDNVYEKTKIAYNNVRKN